MSVTKKTTCYKKTKVAAAVAVGLKHKLPSKVREEAGERCLYVSTTHIKTPVYTRSDLKK